MRYTDSYVVAYPFGKLVKGMMASEMALETVEPAKTATEKEVPANLIINNRAPGIAPIIGQIMAEKLMPRNRSTSRFISNYPSNSHKTS
jgi:hypothetical protein